MSLRQLFEKYRDVIPYLFFGACTTLINVVVYWLAAHAVGLSVMVSTVLAWIVAVLFAYFTNRRWVFHSEAVTARDKMKELVSFFACRLFTGLVDWACMYVFVDLLHFNDLVIKILANVVVIILNYIGSKFFVFSKRKS